MKRYLTIGVALAAAAAAGATTFLAEDFEGSGMPAGWSFAGTPGGTGWGLEPGGPYGQYMYFYATGAPQISRTASLTTSEMDVPAGTVYYSFNSSGSGSNLMYCFAYFYIYQVGTSTPLRTVDLFYGSGPPWGARTGSLAVSGEQNIYARWHLGAGGGMSTYGSIRLFLDEVKFADGPIAVAPLSFGRVKALYR